MWKNFCNWLEDRTGLITALKVVGDRRWVKCLMGLKAFPALMLFLLVIQVVTGFVLWMHYAPGAKSAYESTFYIQNMLWGGWLLRGIHHYAAQFFVAIAILYVLQQILLGLYRVPREATFWVSLFLFFFGLGACLTGDLLAWTQNGYGATMVRVKYLTQIPFIGQALYQMACGGDTVNSVTISHFVAFHIGLFAAGLIVLALIHAVCDARAERNALNRDLASGKLTIPEQKPGACGGCRSTGVARWWSCQAAVNGLACCVVMALILLSVTHGQFGALCCPDESVAGAPGQVLGVTLGPPADPGPTTSFGTARPEWTFRGLYQYALMFSGSVPEFVLIFVVTGCVLGVFFLMPFIARIRFGHLFNLLYTTAFAVVMIMLTLMSYDADRNDENYQQAQAEERAAAGRLFQLVTERGGFTDQGAVAMLKSDWVTQGPKLFAAHCASCHTYAPADDQAEGRFFRMKEPLAPNLYGMTTTAWMAGWLDAKAIRSADYYGYKDSPFLAGTMTDWAKNTAEEIAELEESDDPEDKSEALFVRNCLKQAAEMLVAEAQLTEPRTVVDGKIEGLSDETVEAFEYLACADCHDFYTYKAKTKSGPDLAMYASRAWVARVIADPTAVFVENDRMLSYCVPGAASNPMSEAEVEMLARWLTTADEAK